MTIKSIQRLYLVLKYEKYRIGENVFKGLKKIEICDFEGVDENSSGKYDTEEKIIKINARYYGEKADRKLYDKDSKEIIERRLDIVLIHELWHYYIREYNIEYNETTSKMWGDIITFYYGENHTYILELFKFIMSKIYTEKQRPEEFFVETSAYLTARILDKKINDEENMKKFEIIKDIYDSFKGHIIYNLSRGV